MKRKYKILMILFCLASIGMSLFIYYNMHIHSSEKIMKDNLLNKMNYQEEINRGIFKDYSVKKLQDYENNKALTSEEYFYIAYDFYLDNNMSEAQNFCRLSISSWEKDTDIFIKIYTGMLMDSTSLSQEYDKEFYNLADKILSSITTYDVNKYLNLIYRYMMRTINRENGRELVIDKVEEILKNKERLNDQSALLLNNFMQILYATKGKYAKGLEKCLEAMSILETSQNVNADFYRAKAFANMGEIYFHLGDYESAEKYCQQSLSIEISDENVNKDLNISNYSTLISIASSKNELNKMEEILNLMSQYISKDFTDSIDMIYCFSAVEYFEKRYENSGRSENDEIYIQKAEEYLKRIERFLVVKGNDRVNELDINYKNKLYYLDYLKGNIEDSLVLLEDLYKTYEGDLYKKQILTDITKICTDIGNYEKAYKYSEELRGVYNYEALLINKDIADYSTEKYDYEVQIRRESRHKEKQYIIRFILISIYSLVFVIIFMKNMELTIKNKIDSLTQIYNRNTFNTAYEKMIQSKDDFIVFMFDIDNFKRVNDTYGHSKGDEVLKKVAETAKNTLGKKGDLFRYGGEEFVVLTKVKDKSMLVSLSENIRRNIEELKWDNGMKVTISMGIAESQECEDDPLKLADARLYESKTNGKNKVTWNDI